MGVFSKRDFVIPDGGIDSVEKVTLGGVDQAVLIQAMDPSKPVLLFIHGGPCMPVPGVVSRGQDYAVSIATKELVKHFVVVFWDQRGAGKSFSKKTPAKTIRVEQFISDCKELIDLLTFRFRKKKVYLAGHSWGSIIGLSIASNYPEKLHAYVGISQILNWTDNDKRCFDWLKIKAQTAYDQKTLKKLEVLGQPPYVKTVKQWTDFRQLLLKYNSMIYETDEIKHPGMVGGLKLFLRSSDYTFKDIFDTFYSAYKLTYTKELVEDFAKIDLDKLDSLDVPVYFLHGKQDFHVSGEPVETFFKQLNAPAGKEMVWYENSSHMFHPEDAKKIEGFIINSVKADR